MSYNRAMPSRPRTQVTGRVSWDVPCIFTFSINKKTSSSFLSLQVFVPNAKNRSQVLHHRIAVNARTKIAPWVQVSDNSFRTKNSRVYKRTYTTTLYYNSAWSESSKRSGFKQWYSRKKLASASSTLAIILLAGWSMASTWTRSATDPRVGGKFRDIAL
jgi:hypothetical protein